MRTIRKVQSESGILVLALLSTLICFFDPIIPRQQNTFSYVFILDITRSMNARDYSVSGFPADRLSFAKKSLRHAILQLPCGSNTGIGVFTTRDSMILIEPLEICEHYSVIDKVISNLDWKMAWAADSNIERGLYSGILQLKKMAKNTHLVFLTDGEQTVEELHRPPLAKHAGAIDGFIIGVGQPAPTPVPKLDEQNRITGYWKNHEARNFDLSGQDSRPDETDADQNYLSMLQEPGLIALANKTGLEYKRLRSPGQLGKILNAGHLAVPLRVNLDARWIFASLSLFLISMLYIRRGLELRKLR